MSLIDLSQLPAPPVVENVSFETVLSERLAEFQTRYPEFDALVESDPVYKLVEENAYRETLLRQRINEAAKAVMLAYASGSDLDHLGAIQDVARLLVDPGDPNAIPPIDPTYEDDARLRQRVQLAPERLSVAGPSGAYEFHVLSADADVLDVDVYSPSAGAVTVTVLSALGDGTPAQALLDAVEAALSDRTLRPLTDQVTVQAATIVNYTVSATLYFYDGPDPEVVRQTAEDAVTDYTAEHHRLGHDITLSGVYAALHQPGVQRVVLTAPVADLTVAAQSASYCTGITVTNGGIDE